MLWSKWEESWLRLELPVEWLLSYNQRTLLATTQHYWREQCNSQWLYVNTSCTHYPMYLQLQLRKDVLTTKKNSNCTIHATIAMFSVTRLRRVARLSLLLRFGQHKQYGLGDQLEPKHSPCSQALRLWSFVHSHYLPNTLWRFSSHGVEIFKLFLWIFVIGPEAQGSSNIQKTQVWNPNWIQPMVLFTDNFCLFTSHPPPWKFHKIEAPILIRELP